MKALVVFHDYGCHWLDPLLAEGFRHVLVAVLDDKFWIEMDGRAGLPVMRVMAGKEHDLMAHYKTMGFTVVETETQSSPLRSPVFLANCVGMVKAVLGIRKPFIVTPKQLHSHLRRS